MLRFLMADVSLGRLQVAPVRADFGTMRLDGHSLTINPVARVRQQLANLVSDCSYLPSPKW